MMQVKFLVIMGQLYAHHGFSKPFSFQPKVVSAFLQAILSPREPSCVLLTRHTSRLCFHTPACNGLKWVDSVSCSFTAS